MSEKKIVIPKGMLDAASLSTVKNNDCGQEFMSHYKEWPGIETVVKAVLRWQIENWGTAPNSQRMPDIWYAKSKAKWETFKSQWQFPSQIPFVDLLIFFVTLYHESFLVPEPEDDPRGAVSRQFHKLWTASVGIEGYEKDQWSKMDALLQRAMYPIAPSPEPDAPKTEIGQAANWIIDIMKGYMFTPAEADAIVEELSHVAHRWDRRGR